MIRVVLSLLLVAFSLLIPLSGCNNSKETERGSSEVVEGSIPQIDAPIPENIETATFALG